MKMKSAMIGILAALGVAAVTVSAPTVASAGAAPSPAGNSVHNVQLPTSVTKNAASAASVATTICWPSVSDGALRTWFGAPVSASQAIVASASEGVLNGEGTGDANVYSEGVTVVPSAVIVRIHTGWGAPLNVCVHFVG